MHYGFVPGTKPELKLLGGLVARRETTTLIDRRGVTTLRRFINFLDTTTGIAKPVGDLVIGGHANGRGYLDLPVFPGQRGPTTFETLETTLRDATKSIAIPDALIGYATDDPIERFVHIKGCNIGKAEPFLRKLQEAAGNHVRVTAPKFFYNLMSTSAEGMFEYLAYEFVLPRPTAFPDRATALTDFDARRFPLIDGSVVPAADWASLIPRNPNQTHKSTVPATLGVALRRRRTILAHREYRVRPITFRYSLRYPDAASVPTDDAARRQVLAESLQTHDQFDAAHPFPSWEREGFASFDDFFDGHRWSFRRRGATLACLGHRVVYTVLVALTDPTTTPADGFFGAGNLIFNFYPNVGSGLPPKTGALQESDPIFFATV